jgi:pheromone shutdown protein TraB
MFVASLCTSVVFVVVNGSRKNIRNIREEKKQLEKSIFVLKERQQRKINQHKSTHTIERRNSI